MDQLALPQGLGLAANVGEMRAHGIDRDADALGDAFGIEPAGQQHGDTDLRPGQLVKAPAAASPAPCRQARRPGSSIERATTSPTAQGGGSSIRSLLRAMQQATAQSQRLMQMRQHEGRLRDESPFVEERASATDKLEHGECVLLVAAVYEGRRRRGQCLAVPASDGNSHSRGRECCHRAHGRARDGR